MTNLMLYGLQRSGTNYLECLLRQNFEGFQLNNNHYTRSLPLHKHFRLYDQKHFVPEPKYLNNFIYPDFDSFDQHVLQLTEQPTMHYIIITKEPHSWYLSYCNEAIKNNWPNYMKKWINSQYLIEYNLFCAKWLDFYESEGGQKKILMVRYEDFLHNLDATLDRIQVAFGIQKKHARYSSPAKVPRSGTFTTKRRIFYERGQFAEHFTKNELLAINGMLDKTVTQKLGYSSSSDNHF